MNKCRICGCEADAKKYIAREMKYGTGEEFTYFECPECRCLQLEEIPDNIREYHKTEEDSFTYKPEEAAERMEINHSRVLEIGCGKGEFLCSLYDRGYDNLTGYDAFLDEDISYANGVKIYAGDIDRLEGRYDLIFIRDSFGYETEPETLMEKLGSLLAPGGTLRIDTPVYPNIAFDMFETSWYQLDAPRNVYLYSRESIELMAKRHGLKVREVNFDSNKGQISRSYMYQQGIAYWEQTPVKIDEYLVNQELIKLMESAATANQDGNGDHAVFYLTHDTEKADKADDNKFAFIICNTNQQYFEECINYVSMLEVPEGITVDIMGIDGMEDMAAAYQAAMRESDARYKAYVSPECFIFNKNFISDCIRLFEIHREYGLIGVTGTRRRVADGAYWKTADVGTVDRCSTVEAYREEHYRGEDCLEEVDAVSGILMVTQYDIDWPDNSMTGTNFFDIAQSMEFHRAGYKVGVVNEPAWCCYDKTEIMPENYDISRKHFCEEYSDMGFEYADNERLNLIHDRNEKAALIYPEIEDAFAKKDLRRVAKLSDSVFSDGAEDYFAAMTGILCRIYNYQESLLLVGFDFENDDYDTLVQKYNYYKFLLRRIQYRKKVEDYTDVIRWIYQYEDKRCSLGRIIAAHTVIEVERIGDSLVKLIKNDIYQTEEEIKRLSVEDKDRIRATTEAIHRQLINLKELSDMRKDIIVVNADRFRGFGEKLFEFVRMCHMEEYKDRVKFARDAFRCPINKDNIYGRMESIDKALDDMEKMSENLMNMMQ